MAQPPRKIAPYAYVRLSNAIDVSVQVEMRLRGQTHPYGV